MRPEITDPKALKVAKLYAKKRGIPVSRAFEEFALLHADPEELGVFRNVCEHLVEEVRIEIKGAEGNPASHKAAANHEPERLAA